MERIPPRYVSGIHKTRDTDTYSLVYYFMKKEVCFKKYVIYKKIF